MATARRRPVVVVEDHLYHIDRLLATLCEQGPDLLEHLTVVCLDRPGPDTRAAVVRWLSEYPEVTVVADVADMDGAEEGFFQLRPAVYTSNLHCARAIAEHLAPRGLLVQDIQLETLEFVPADQWWESISLGVTVRGAFASRPPRVLFMSNKRGFHVTFARDLNEVGFDPCDVLDKDQLEGDLLPALRQRLRESFPLELELGDQSRRWQTGDPEEREQLVAEFDFISWGDRPAIITLGGRGLREPLELDSSADEAQTWRELLAAHLEGRPGIPTEALGERLKPGLSRAERINQAARHILKLRARLVSRDMIQTVNHHYRLAEEAQVGRIRRRPRP